MPGPEVPGSKVPVEGFVIPIPLQVPPAFTAERLTGELLEQNGPAGLIVASGVLFIVIGKVVGDAGAHPLISD